MTAKRGRGQPTKYTPELASRICELISTCPDGLPTIIKNNPDLPDRQTIYNWIHTYKDFFDNYMRAKEQQAHLLADEVLQVHKDVPKYQDKDGVTRIDNGILGLAKLQMDALRWSAGVLAPKFYKESKDKENNTELHQDVMKRRHELDEKNKKDF